MRAWWSLFLCSTPSKKDPVRLKFLADDTVVLPTHTKQPSYLGKSHSGIIFGPIFVHYKYSYVIHWAFSYIQLRLFNPCYDGYPALLPRKLERECACRMFCESRAIVRFDPRFAMAVHVLGNHHTAWRSHC